MKWVKTYDGYGKDVSWINLDHVWRVKFIVVVNRDGEKVYDAVEFSVDVPERQFRWAPKFKTETEARQAFGNLIGEREFEYRNKRNVVIESVLP